MPELSSQLSAAHPPKYNRQKSKHGHDRAYVRIDGQRIYLGEYGSSESRQRYAKLIGSVDNVNTSPGPVGPVTVNEVIVAYLEHTEVYYRTPDGQPGREHGLIGEVSKIVRREAGKGLAEDFGPLKLIAIREVMIAEGWTRKYINKQVDRVRRMFRWAASREMISPTVPQALGMLDGLHQGRSDAKESTPVLPVADADVTATLEHLPMVVADMARVQRLTGMRPGELVIMRPCDIDRTAEVWLYKPSTHKTQHHGHARVVAIGPKCQEILLRYLARGAEDFLFQPRDSEAKRRAALTEARVVPMSCGNTVGSARLDSPQQQPGEAYTVGSYRRAITRAAVRAGVEAWTPHRLRHTAATEVRREFGLDAAQSVLGHRNAQITQVYAELDTAKAAAVALRIG